MKFDDYIELASPEQKIFLERAVLKSASNQIVPYFYNGIVGGEWSTYNPSKLYFALEMTFAFNAAIVTGAYVEFFDENNLDNGIHTNFAPYWDATATTMKGYANTLVMNNFYFSRFIASSYNWIKFIGFKSLS